MDKKQALRSWIEEMVSLDEIPASMLKTIPKGQRFVSKLSKLKYDKAVK